MSHRAYTTVVGQPPAGTDWSFQPAGSDWWRLLSIVATLTTSDTDGSRAPDIIVTDQTGNVISRDINAAPQAASIATVYTWRERSMQYGEDAAGGTVAGSIPGFWIPSDATVSALTANLDPATPAVQASVDTGDQSANLPVVIVTGVNDTFGWTGMGGGGPPEDFVIAPGTYTTVAQVAAAMEAAVGMTSGAFSTQAAVTDDGAGGYLLTAVADIGAVGNGDTLSNGSIQDAYVTIFGVSGPFTLANGAEADGGDQWTNIVATYVVADARHWLTLEAMIDQFAAR